MRLDKILKETAYGQTNEINVEYGVYAPTYQEALTMLRVPLQSAAVAIQDLPQGTTWDELARQKGPMGLSKAAQFITARELSWRDVKKTVGELAAAGKLDRMLPTDWQRQLLLELLKGACKYSKSSYQTE